MSVYPALDRIILWIEGTEMLQISKRYEWEAVLIHFCCRSNIVPVRFSLDGVLDRICTVSVQFLIHVQWIGLSLQHFL